MIFHRPTVDLLVLTFASTIGGHSEILQFEIFG